MLLALWGLQDPAIRLQCKARLRGSARPSLAAGEGCIGGSQQTAAQRQGSQTCHPLRHPAEPVESQETVR